MDWEKIITLCDQNWHLILMLICIIFIAIILILLIITWLKFKKTYREWLASISIKTNNDQIETSTIVQAEITSAVQELSAAPPEANLDPESFFVEMLKLQNEPDRSKLEQAFKKLQNSESNTNNQLCNEGIYYKILYDRGDISALQQIANLVNKHKKSQVGLFLACILAGIYNQAIQFEKTVKLLGPLLTIQSDIYNSRAIATRRLSEAYLSLGSKDAAYKLILKEIHFSTNPEETLALYHTLAWFFQETDSPELRALALEKILEIRPNDNNALFQAAYSYSTFGYHDLAYFCYKQLLSYNPSNETAMNNIAVNCEHLKMPYTAVRYYKQASEKNSLAAANLAFIYMKSGFADEAKKLLDKVRGSSEEVHPDIATRIATIIEQEKNESKNKVAITEIARQKRLFFFNYATNLFQQSLFMHNLTGLWNSVEGIGYQITQKENQIDVRWVNDKKVSQHATGIISNNTFKATIRNEGASTSHEGTSYAIINSLANTISVMTIKGIETAFATLTKVNK